MYAVWKGELINGSGKTLSPRPRPWVAEIQGRNKRWKYNRDFLPYVDDYTVARSTGSRGIWRYFYLPPGLYECYRSSSWKHHDRFFARVDENGVLYKITEHELNGWIDVLYPQWG